VVGYRTLVGSVCAPADQLAVFVVHAFAESLKPVVLENALRRDVGDRCLGTNAKDI
jgi:hypothetical protein